VLQSVSINIMQCIIYVDVRLVVIILGKESPFITELYDSHVGHVLAMDPLSAYVINIKLQPHSTI